MSEEAKDQTDIIQANEKLTAEVEVLRTGAAAAAASIEKLTADLAASQLSLDAATKGGETLLAVTAERTKERDALKAENDSLKTAMVDFDKRVATAVAKHGIAPAAIVVEKASSEKPPTATEKVLEIKGVGSLAELASLKK